MKHTGGDGAGKGKMGKKGMGQRAGREILGCSRMRRLFRQARRMAATTAPVIVFGESGTGKELVANWIHRESRRSAGAFVTVNCGGMQPSLLLDAFFGHDRGAFTGAD